MKTTARNRIMSVLILTASLLLVYTPTIPSSAAATLPSIDLEGFRWNSFPLRVLVDMNAWSTPDYAVAVREALDDWLRSIWNYTSSFNDTSLTMIRFAFYVSDINRTDNYNALVTFAASEIGPRSETVGLTTARWNPQTHEPIPPVTVNITTYSATASHLFVRNVAMHELGHMLGLGHASPQNTLDGPELMYYISSRNSILFPSTLDVYGLTVLYGGMYGQTVQLPADIPYKILSEGTFQPPTSDFWENLPTYVPLLAAIAAILILVPILLRMGRTNKPEQTAQEIPQQPDGAQASATSKEDLNCPRGPPSESSNRILRTRERNEKHAYIRIVGSQAGRPCAYGHRGSMCSLHGAGEVDSRESSKRVGARTSREEAERLIASGFEFHYRTVDGVDLFRKKVVGLD